MATARNSTFYANKHVNFYVGDPRQGGGREVPIPFEFTIVSVAATGDTYKLGVIPANARVVGLTCVGEGIGASAGSGVTVKIGDSGDDDRYMKALDSDLVEQPVGVLAFSGAGYTPTVDTIFLATITGTPVVGKSVKGSLVVIPGN